MTDAGSTHSSLPPELDPRGPRRSAATASGGRRSRARRPLAWVAGSLAVLTVGFSLVGNGVANHYEGKITRVSVFNGLTNRPAKVSGSAENILLVGSDSRAGLSRNEIAELHVGSATATNAGGRRSDTMILLHISKDRGTATLLSLPRDSYVVIPAYTDAQGKKHPESHNKLNAAYAFGGPQLAVATVEANTGVRVDHYIEIGFDGFVRMVNAVGTVPICTPKALNDPKSGLNIPAGTTQLDGATALKYVRARYVDPRADLGRIDRQQAFLAALFRRAMSSQILLNPIKLNSFLDAVLAAVTTDPDLSRADIVDLATSMRSVAAGNVVFATIPMANVNYSVNGIGSTVLWDDAKAQQVFNAFRTDTPLVKPATTATPTTASAPTVAPSQISLVVLNGAGVAGLAGRAANDLQQLGFVLAGPGGERLDDRGEPDRREVRPELERVPEDRAGRAPRSHRSRRSRAGQGLQGRRRLVLLRRQGGHRDGGPDGHRDQQRPGADDVRGGQQPLQVLTSRCPVLLGLADGPRREDRRPAGQPVAAPDLRLPPPALVLVGLPEQRRHLPHRPGRVDGDEHQVGRGDPRGRNPGLVPALGEQPNTHLQ